MKPVEDVARTVPAKAAWGVTRRVAAVEDVEGNVVGRVAGGRFFLVERTERRLDGTWWLIGNFTPKALPKTVRVSSEDLLCLTCSPARLTEKEQSTLRRYYELRGEAEEIKERLQREAAAKSPYSEAAAEAVRAYRAKVKEAELANATTDEGVAARQALAGLKARMEELNRQHKEWKAAHAAELSDPEADPAYRAKLEECRRCGGPIGWLAL